MLKKKKYEDMRSCWEFGEAEECRRGLMLGMGYTEEELHRPLIGIVNSWNEYNPGHVHLNKLAERVKQGVREAGGLPLEVMTTGICDGMVLKDPKYIEVTGLFTPRGGISIYPYANYGRPGTKYEELAAYRLQQHDI